jgi:hypothetical protein
MTPCSAVLVADVSGPICFLHILFLVVSSPLDPDVGGIAFFRNVGELSTLRHTPEGG